MSRRPPIGPSLATQSLRRLLVLAALLLGMVVQPGLASMGALHEYYSHVAATAPDADHSHADDHHGTASADEEGERESVVHVLMHLAHCCGQVLAMPTALPDTTPVVLHDALPMPQLASPPAGHAGTPFRPPIDA